MSYPGKIKFKPTKNSPNVITFTFTI